MKVILTSKVPNLGNVGEIVKVTVGHARNYLFPQKLAVLADEAHKKSFDNYKRRLAKKVEAEKKTATDLKAKLDGLAMEFVKKVGPNGKLFGSITPSDLSEELGKKGFEIEKRLLVLTSPIKQVGSFTVKAKLFHGVEAKLQVKVVMDPEQAEELKLRQAAALKKKKEAAAAKAEDNAETAKSTDDALTDEASEIVRS